MLDTLVHGETAFLADVAQEVMVREATAGGESGFDRPHRVVFKKPRTVDYRASVHDIADHLIRLMENPQLREKMGAAGRKHVVANYDYRVVAKQFLDTLSRRMGIT